MSNHLFEAFFTPYHGNHDQFILTRDATVSCTEFLQSAARFAHCLVAAGVKPGDRVAVQVEKSVGAFMLYAACIQSGAVFLPLNIAYKSAELEYFIGDATPAVVVVDPVSVEVLTPIARSHNCKLFTMDAAGGGSLAEAAGDCPDTFVPVHRDKRDLAAILYTSGTTGRSKGAMLTHENLLSNAEDLVKIWHFTSDDVLLHALPIFHAHGLFVGCHVALLSRARLLWLPKFDLDQVIEQLPRATSIMGVPTFYTRLLGDERFDRTLTAHMWLFISGSAPLLAETHIQFEKRTGHRILERYGMTETGLNSSNPYHGERRAGTVGLPLPRVEVKITNPETGEEVSDAVIGMLEVRGPNVFAGYWRLPEKTAEDLRENGFLITGDLATRSPDGYITIVGRQKDLIISGGYNVYPKELELLLDEIDGVVESAVIGVPHPDFGEAVVAVLVGDPAKLEPQTVMDTISDKIARFKQPKRIVIVDELPRNTMGKVQKNLLRDAYKNRFAE